MEIESRMEDGAIDEIVPSGDTVNVGEARMEKSDRTGSEVFADELYSMLDYDILLTMRKKQLELVNLLQQTNRTLQSFNDFSEIQYAHVANEFKSRVALLKIAKTDLDDIFSRLRLLKSKIETKIEGGPLKRGPTKARNRVPL